MKGEVEPVRYEDEPSRLQSERVGHGADPVEYTADNVEYEDERLRAPEGHESHSYKGVDTSISTQALVPSQGHADANMGKQAGLLYREELPRLRTTRRRSSPEIQPDEGSTTIIGKSITTKINSKSSPHFKITYSKNKKSF